MGVAPIDAKVVPDRVTVKTLGILNVVFALGLLGSGLCINMCALVYPWLSTVMKVKVDQDARAEASRKASVQRLDEQIQKASGPEKEKLRKEREELAEPPSDPQAEIAKTFADPRLRDARLVGQFAMDLLTGIFVNLLMLISGVGLLYYKAWGRYLAIAVAWLKIVRLLILMGAAFFILAPFLGTAVTQIETEAAAGDPPAIAAASQDGAAVAGMVRTYAAGVLLVGVIYPAVTIGMLRRPSAKAAVQRVR